MLKVISLAVYLLGSLAMAQTDKNEIVPRYCGKFIGGSEICLLQTLDGHEYISESTSTSREALSVISKTKSTINSKWAVYTAVSALCNEHSCHEQRMELTIMNPDDIGTKTLGAGVSVGDVIFWFDMTQTDQKFEK